MQFACRLANDYESLLSAPENPHDAVRFRRKNGRAGVTRLGIAADTEGSSPDGVVVGLLHHFAPAIPEEPSRGVSEHIRTSPRLRGRRIGSAGFGMRHLERDTTRRRASQTGP